MTAWQEPPVTLARAVGPRGEVALRRRTRPAGLGPEVGEPGEEIFELVVNGAFAMDQQRDHHRA